MSPSMPRPIIVAETLPRVNTRARPRNAPGKRGAPKLQPGTVQIYCADPPRGLIVLLGTDPVKLTGGGGGWENVTRPHQTSMTLWQGSEPWGLQLPLMLDDYAERGGVERAMRVLGRLVKGDDDSEPGVVEIGGIPLPVDEWVIESIDYGDPIRGVTDMRLLRQPCTLMLREYVPPEYVRLRRRSLLKPRRKTKVVTVKKGDTPAKIARRFKCKWTALRELNPKIVRKAHQKARPRDEKKAKFRVGVKIRVPVKPTPKKGGGRRSGGHHHGDNVRTFTSVPGEWIKSGRPPPGS